MRDARGADEAEIKEKWSQCSEDCGPLIVLYVALSKPFKPFT